MYRFNCATVLYLFLETLESCGAKIELLEPHPELPDLVFTANAALVRGKNAYLSHFFNKERVGERQQNLKWFQSNGYSVFGGTDISYEG